MYERLLLFDIRRLAAVVIIGYLVLWRWGGAAGRLEPGCLPLVANLNDLSFQEDALLNLCNKNPGHIRAIFRESKFARVGDWFTHRPAVYYVLLVEQDLGWGFSKINSAGDLEVLVIFSFATQLVAALLQH